MCLRLLACSSQPVEMLRGFFDAFFTLDMETWGGFLAGWPGLPGNDKHATYLARIQFGISIFLKFPPKARGRPRIQARRYPQSSEPFPRKSARGRLPWLGAGVLRHIFLQCLAVWEGQGG